MLAGAIEEPVFVGLLVLLWPRRRARTFVLLALLSGVVRAGIHLYYASGVAFTGWLGVVANRMHCRR